MAAAIKADLLMFSTLPAARSTKVRSPRHKRAWIFPVDVHHSLWAGAARRNSDPEIRRPARYCWDTVQKLSGIGRIYTLHFRRSNERWSAMQSEIWEMLVRVGGWFRIMLKVRTSAKGFVLILRNYVLATATYITDRKIRRFYSSS